MDNCLPPDSARVKEREIIISTTCPLACQNRPAESPKIRLRAGSIRKSWAPCSQVESLLKQLLQLFLELGNMHRSTDNFALRVNEELSDPTRRIVVYCEFGRVSTLATATLRQMGFRDAVALDGGMKAWREAGFALKVGKEP